MTLRADQFAINPLQWFASADGWLDFTIAPPLPQRLATIREAGFTTVQTDVPAEHSPDSYRALLADHGIRPGPGYLSLSWPDDPAPVLERARHLAATNVALGAPLLFLAMGMSRDAVRVTHPAVGHAADSDRLARVRDLLARAAEIATEEGAIPALHPHVGTWVETEAETRFVLDTTDPTILKFGPDTGHLAWTGVDPTELIAAYAGRIAGVHIKDLHADVAKRGRDEDLDYRATVLSGLWTEPGSGDADLATTLSALPADFAGTVVIEVDRGSIEPNRSVLACGDWLRGFLA